MRVPTYGAVVSLAAMLGVGAFLCVLVLRAPSDGLPDDRSGRRARSDPAPSDPDELEEWLGRNPESPRWWLELGNARHGQGRAEDARRAWSESLRLYEGLIARGERLRPGSWYNRACCLARLGDSDEAFEALRQAVENGWDDRDHTASDADLESIRSDPRFEEFVKSMPERPRIFNAG